MADPIAFRVLTRADLEAGVRDPAWIDPDSVAGMSPPRRRTMLENPLADNPGDPAQMIATRGNEIIGRIDFIPGLLHSPAGDQRIFWFSNFFVAERHRNTLAGVSLILRSQQLLGIVGAFGPSRKSLPIYQRLKWLDRAIPRYILVRRSRSIAERYLRRGPHSLAASLLADGGLGLYRLLQAPVRAIRTRGLTVERVPAMPPELDPLLSPPPGVVAVHRSASFINWWLTNRFKDDDPRDRNDLYLVRDRRQNVVAYFLNKVRFFETATHRRFRNLRLGFIHDWRIFDHDSVDLQSVIMLATRELGRCGVDAIELSTDESSMDRPLKRMGFMRVDSVHLLVHPSRSSPLSAPPFQDLSKWLIWPGDGDNYLN